MQLALSGKNIPDDLREICEGFNIQFLLKNLRANWLWFCPFITSNVSIPVDMSDEYVLAILNDQYIQLRDFDKRLVVVMSEGRADE